MGSLLPIIDSLNLEIRFKQCFPAPRALNRSRNFELYPKFYGPLPSMLLIRITCLSFVHLQDYPRNVFHCFLHELAVEISSCPQMVIGSNFLYAHFNDPVNAHAVPCTSRKFRVPHSASTVKQTSQFFPVQIRKRNSTNSLQFGIALNPAYDLCPGEMLPSATSSPRL